MTMRIRGAEKSDAKAVSEVVRAAFGPDQGPEIERLVTDLLDDATAAPVVSLVAESDQVVVGHILFTRARFEQSDVSGRPAILAPLSVHPGHQGMGVGKRLISEGLRDAGKTGYDLVFVLGHPAYYQKRGFVSAGRFGFVAPYPIQPKNADAWMVQEVRRGALSKQSCRVMCANALDDPKHWIE